MSSTAKLSYTSAMILASIDAGAVYGLSIMELTGLPSGTVYPAMRRLEAAKLITAQWEDERIATRELRPARKYYKLTKSGAQALKSQIADWLTFEAAVRKILGDAT